MTWLLTSKGREHHLCAPHATHSSNVPTLTEIAHSLAHINRFTGHASRAYSVAEHSLLVMDIAKYQFHADAGGQLAALMHDAHECIVGDVASPVKEVLGPVWRAFEQMHEQHLRSSFGLTALFAKHAAMVKCCDLIALATERRDLMRFDKITSTPWPILDSFGKRVYAYPDNLNAMVRRIKSPPEWAVYFEETAEELMAELAGEVAAA